MVSKPSKQANKGPTGKVICHVILLCVCTFVHHLSSILLTQMTTFSLLLLFLPSIHSGTMDCARKVLRSEGPSGFFKGFAVTAYREVPSLGLYFLTYKNMHTALHDISDLSTWFPSMAATLLAGGCAGASSWVVVYPIDVIKTVVQTTTDTGPGGANLSPLSVAQRLLREHGVRVFFRGMGTTVTRAFPVNGITFLGYEKFKTLMDI